MQLFVSDGTGTAEDRVTEGSIMKANNLKLATGLNLTHPQVKPQYFTHALFIFKQITACPLTVAEA